MNLETVYWLIPGYLCLLVYFGAQGIRHQGTWDFLIKLAPASAACSFLAQIILHFLSKTPEITFFGNGTHGEVSGNPDLLLVLSLALAAPIGLLSPRPIQYLFFLVEKYRRKWGIDSAMSERPNLVSWQCAKLLGKMVQVSTRSGKVYSGYLLAYSSDDKIPALLVAPFISGYRKPDLKVTFNTLYIGPNEDISSVKRRELIIPFSEVCSIAEFDLDFHMKMYRDGALSWEFPVNHAPSETPADT